MAWNSWDHLSELPQQTVQIVSLQGRAVVFGGPAAQFFQNLPSAMQIALAGERCSVPSGRTWQAKRVALCSGQKQRTAALTGQAVCKGPHNGLRPLMQGVYSLSLRQNRGGGGGVFKLKEGLAHGLFGAPEWFRDRRKPFLQHDP